MALQADQCGQLDGLRLVAVDQFQQQGASGRVGDGGLEVRAAALHFRVVQVAENEDGVVAAGGAVGRIFGQRTGGLEDLATQEPMPLRTAHSAQRLGDLFTPPRILAWIGGRQRHARHHMLDEVAAHEILLGLTEVGSAKCLGRFLCVCLHRLRVGGRSGNLFVACWSRRCFRGRSLRGFAAGCRRFRGFGSRSLLGRRRLQRSAQQKSPHRGSPRPLPNLRISVSLIEIPHYRDSETA